jgi:hypothetical protein
MSLARLAAACALAAPALAAGDPIVLVVCAPGYPGSTAEAQPALDAFAAAASEAAGLPAGRFGAVYHETEKGGLERVRKPDAAFALVPLPFLLQHGAALELAPRLAAVRKGGEASEAWTLVAKKGRVTGPASLAGWQVASLAGYAPGFVRGALGAFGRLPESARIVQTGQVLSFLRKAAAGEEVALLLDREQADALQSLPFAGDLEVVARSAPLPGAILCAVGKRASPAEAKALAAGLLRLGSSPAGAAALDGIRLSGFAPLDEAGLAAARRLSGAPGGKGR